MLIIKSMLLVNLYLFECRVGEMGREKTREGDPLSFPFPSHLADHAPCCVFYEESWTRVSVRDI